MKNRYFLLALSLLVAPAYALNMSVLKDAPMTRLNADELKTFTTVIMDTLENGPDGATVEWSAPKTRFTSRITPGAVTTDAKRTCRNATIESEAKDRFQRGTYSFCKAAGGKWQLSAQDSKPSKPAKK